VVCVLCLALGFGCGGWGGLAFVYGGGLLRKLVIAKDFSTMLKFC